MFDTLMKYVKDFCNDDETCIICVLVLAGFLLCVLINNKTDGFTGALLEDAFNKGDQGSGKGSEAQGSGTVVKTGPTSVEDIKVGQELKPRESEKIPADLQRKLALARQGSNGAAAQINQGQGLVTQDASIYMPFDEVWNPGFMPINMVFKGATEPAGLGSKGVIGVNGVARGNGGSLNTMRDDTKNGEAKIQGGETAPQGELKMILVYAPWCGHSKKMLPDYEKVKSEFDGQTINNSKVSVIMYNSEVDKAKVKEYEVKGFPTLFVEKDGELSPFPHRTYDKISEYIKQNA